MINCFRELATDACQRSWSVLSFQSSSNHWGTLFVMSTPQQVQKRSLHCDGRCSVQEIWRVRCYAALMPHITRANYTAMRDKSYRTSCPVLPSIDQNGWSLEKGEYVPVTCLTLPAPRAVLELTKCVCRSGCGGRCSCSKNGLPCTPLCKYYGVDCSNTIKNDGHNDDDEDDDDE